jgi:hypothetical protein
MPAMDVLQLGSLAGDVLDVICDKGHIYLVGLGRAESRVKAASSAGIVHACEIRLT